MKKYLIFTLILFVNFIACNTEDTPPVDIDPIENETPGFSLEIDGKEFQFNDYFYDGNDKNIPYVLGTNDSLTISWNFDGGINVKEYILGNNETLLITSMYEYTKDGLISYDILEGKLNITEFDLPNKILKGTFSFTADGNGTSRSIKNGLFFINNFK